MKPLNDFLIIITDQERATQHFPPNWEENNLPVMTALKQTGISFDRAFCNTCMCSPSRSTLLTSNYPAQHHVTQTLTTGGNMSDAEQTLSNTYPNIARVLANEGYDCQWRGKWHVSKGQDGSDPYGNVTAEDIALFGFKGWVGPDSGEDAHPENFGGGYANHDVKYIEQAIEYLEQVRLRREKGDNTPFLLVLSLVNPHDVLGYPNQVQYGYFEEEYTQRDVPLPATWDEDLLENKKPMAQFQTNIAADGLLGVLKDKEMKLNYINFYAYLLKKVDSQIGEVVNKLRSSSLIDNTIVFRTSDHGEMGLAHGGMRQKAFVAYEEALRVPLVISNPILFPQGRRTNNLATLADVLPTLCDMVGAVVPADVRGVSLMPVIDSDMSVQDEVLFTFDDTKSGSNSLPSSVKAANRIRCIRTDKWKYVVYFDALDEYVEEEELYNLEEDANEYNNLAYSKEYQSKKIRMQMLMKKLMRDKLNIRDVTYDKKTFVETNPVYQTYAYNSLDEEQALKSKE